MFRSYEDYPAADRKVQRSAARSDHELKVKGSEIEMTSIWKRSLSLFLAIVMVVGMIPFSALAADEEVIEEEVLEIFEEVPEEEIVEEIIEEEIIEEEIFEEEVFEEIVEEEVVEEEVFFHTSDEVANAAAEDDDVPIPGKEDEADGIIWVNKGTLEDDIIDVVAGGVNFAVLKAVGIMPEDATSEEELAEYYYRYTVTYDGENVATEDFLLNQKDSGTLKDAVSKDGYAVFGIEEKISLTESTKWNVKIEFADSRIALTVAIDNSEKIENNREMTAEEVYDIIVSKITVEGEDPRNGAVDVPAEDYEISVTDFDWPVQLNPETTVTATVAFTDATVYDLDTKSVWTAEFTLLDTRARFTVTYDVDGEKEQFLALDGDKTPSYEEPTKQYYTFNGWSPAVADTVTKDITYTATWKPINDNNKDGTADELDTYTIIFYDPYDAEGNLLPENEWVGLAYKKAKWGDSFSTVAEVPTKAGWNFAGWEPSLPEKVTAPSKPFSYEWGFKATWTKDPVVNFVSPVTKQVDPDAVQRVALNGYAENPGQRWNGYHVKFWYVEGDATKTPFNFEETAVTAPLTLVPEAFVDRNNNGKIDGSAAVEGDNYTGDPWYVYEWYDGEEQLEAVKWLASEMPENPDDYCVIETSYTDSRIFTGWDKVEDTNIVNGVQTNTVIFTAEFVKDINNNEVDDENEKITVTVNGAGEVNLKTGFYNSTADSIDVVATPVVVDGISKTYVSEIMINGNPVAPDFTNYVAETALTKDDYKPEITVEITFADAAFTDGEGKVQADIYNDGYEPEGVYAGAVSAPAYKDATEATVKYKVHKELSVDLDVSSLKQTLIDKVGLEIWEDYKDMYYDLTGGDDVYTHTYQETWNDVNVDVVNKDAKRVLSDLEAYIKATHSGTLYKEMNAKIEQFKADINATGMHNFGEEPVETVKVTYTDDAKHLEGTYEIAIVDDRIVTEIVAADTEVVYGQYTATDLLKNVTLKGDTTGVYVDGNVDEIVKYGVGTYTIYVKYDANETHKGSEASYKLTVKKAPLTIKFGDDNIMVSPENGNKWNTDATPITTPNTDQIVHLIAGVDLESSDVDLGAGKINKIGAKAWMQIPSDLMALPEVKESLVDGEYSVSAIQELLADKRLEAVIPASAKSQLDAGLSMISNMIKEANKGDMLIDVNFVDEELGESVFPTEIGVYVNMAVSIDSNYNVTDPVEIEVKEQKISVDALGFIMIHPGVALPNNGLDLKLDGEVDGLNFYSFDNGAIKELIVEGDETCEVRYFGLTNSAKKHQEGVPTEPGIYVASALKTNDQQEVISDAAIVVVYAQETEIKVDNQIVFENGEAQKPAIINEDNAALTVISAEADLGKKSVVVNVDFPQGVYDVIDYLNEQNIPYVDLPEIKIPADGDLDDVIAAIEAIPGKIEEALKSPLDKLKDFGISVDDYINPYLDRGYGYFYDVADALKGIQTELKGANITVTFGDHNGYSKPGVYYYAAVVTDPDFKPTASFGAMIIETKDFELNDTTVTVGQEYMSKLVTNKTGHDYITVVSGNGNVNIVLDNEYGSAIREKLAAYIDKDLVDGKEYPVSALETKIEPWADKIADILMEEFTTRVTEKVEAKVAELKYVGAYATYAIDKMEAALEAELNEKKAKLVNELNEQIAKYSNLTLTVNGELPTEVGTYKVRALSYAVAYDAAVLEIQEAKDLFKIRQASIKAGDSLDMFFYCRIEDLKGEDYYAVVTKTFADGRPDVVKSIPYSEWEVYSDTQIRFVFDDISAKEMTDEIYATVYHKDGTEASYEFTATVQMYAQKALVAYKNDSELVTTLIDMLNYGAGAQDWFEYNKSELANNGMDEYQQYATQSVEYTNRAVKGKNFKTFSVSAKNNLMLTMYFENITKDMTAHISYTHHTGKVENYVIAGSEFYYNSDLPTCLGIDVMGLSIADGRQLVSCVIKDAEGNEIGSGVASIESYCALMKGRAPVFEVLMRFVESAYSYFH